MKKIVIATLVSVIVLALVIVGKSIIVLMNAL